MVFRVIARSFSINAQKAWIIFLQIFSFFYLSFILITCKLTMQKVMPVQNIQSSSTTLCFRFRSFSFGVRADVQNGDALKGVFR